MIKYHGQVEIPEAVISSADTIKHLNYRTSTPAKFRKNALTSELAGSLMEAIASRIGVSSSRLDYVYFSVCRGAEPHVDILSPDEFHSTTFVVPVILPSGFSVITAMDDRAIVQVGGIYEFNHEQEHSMIVEDEVSGCVVIMIAIRRQDVV